MHSQAMCWINGIIIPLPEATIPVTDHGLLYGDGIFEGIRIYHGQAFRLQQHLERLRLSAKAIALTIPYDGCELVAAINQLVAAFKGETGYLRLTVTRGSGALGLNPAGCNRPNVIIVADQLQLIGEQQREQGARLIIAATRRLPADGLDPRIKSLNYLNHILAKLESNYTGADEALLLNSQGRIAEGTAENVFLVRNGIIATPPCTEGALQGITRQLVLELAIAAGITVQETPLAPYDAYTADECFLTGTGAELIPVREIDGRATAYCPGPVFQQLHRLFIGLIAEESGVC